MHRGPGDCGWVGVRTVEILEVDDLRGLRAVSPGRWMGLPQWDRMERHSNHLTEGGPYHTWTMEVQLV